MPETVTITMTREHAQEALDACPSEDFLIYDWQRSLFNALNDALKGDYVDADKV
jgi:hypothetical protein